MRHEFANMYMYIWSLAQSRVKLIALIHARNQLQEGGGKRISLRAFRGHEAQNRAYSLTMNARRPSSVHAQLLSRQDSSVAGREDVCSDVGKPEMDGFF